MINQFPAGKLWDEYDKAMSQINDLTARATAAEAELHRIGSQLNEEIGKQILRAEAAEARAERLQEALLEIHHIASTSAGDMTDKEWESHPLRKILVVIKPLGIRWNMDTPPEKGGAS